MSSTLNLLTKQKTGTKKEKAVEHLDSIQRAVFLIEGLDEVSAQAKAKELLDSADESLFVFGGILDAIYTNAWHTGYEGFKEYVEEQFGMKIRKAMYLMKIYNDIVENEIPWEKVVKLGWTKLRVISGVLTLDNVDEWVERAEGMTVMQLQEYLKAMQKAEHEGDTEGLEEEQVATVTTFQVKVHEDQRETILDAIGAAKDVSGTEFDAVALEYICMDYLGGSSADAVAKVSLSQIMQNHSAKEVLTAFGGVFPEVKVSAEL